jgi:subtilisin family serine protease
MVEDAGGTVVRLHPEIGVAVASGLSDASANGIAGRGEVARDLMLQWQDGDVMVDLSEAEEIPVDSFSDPTAAAYFWAQWGMRNISADDAWNAGFTGDPTVRVAVVDSGIDPFHPDMVGLIDEAASIAFTPSYSYLINPAAPDWADDRFHGTHVAGIIATNNVLTAGVAPNTTLIAIKSLNYQGSGAFSWIIGGILHAVAVDADVINMSLGYYGGIPKNLPGAGPLVAAYNKAVNYANSNGVLVVSAAGNDGMDMQHSGNVTFIPCESGAGTCVSATDYFDDLADYSNFGTSAVNFAAPGGALVTGASAWDYVWSTCSTVSVLYSCPLGIIGATGTSMATPHVSGAAALLDAQYGGELGPAQLKTKLQQTADDLGKRGADPYYGKGRINVCELVGCQ